MASTEQTYREAAKEHLSRAYDEFDDGAYYLSHYLSGLAVECYRRAYLRRKTSEFDSRHDLQMLAKESGFYGIVPQGQALHFSTIFATMNLRWRSNHRYYSERQLLDYLGDIRAEFNTRGDRWKNLARTVLRGASEVIEQGEAKW
jgi:hypothetical protein